MFKTKNPEIKNFIWNLVMFTDEVSTDGKLQIRSTYPKKFFRPSIKIKNQIKDQIQVVYISKDEQIEQLCSIDEWDKSKGEFLRERHTEDAEIEFDRKEIEALKHYYKERDEISIISEESLDEFEKGIGV